MALFNGLSKLKGQVGATKLKAAYVGATKVWSAAAPFIGSSETQYLYMWEDAENPGLYAQFTQVSSSGTAKVYRICVRKSDGTIIAEVYDSYRTNIYKANLNNLSWVKSVSYEHDPGNGSSEYYQGYIQEIRVLNNVFYFLDKTYNRVLYSYDGLTWLSVGLNRSINTDTDGVARSMAYHKGNYFIVHGRGNIIYTSNPTNWTVTTPVYSVGRGIEAVGSNGTYLFTAGASGYGSVSRSIDGVTGWVEKLFDKTMYTARFLVASGSNIMVCFQGIIAYSKDMGENWAYKEFSEIPNAQYTCIDAKYVDGVFTAIFYSNNGSVNHIRYMITTKDFITWKLTAMTDMSAVSKINCISSLEGE